MAKKCMVATIKDQSTEMGSFRPDNVSQQSMVVEPEDSDGVAAGDSQCEELEKVIIGSDEDKFFQVGTQLSLAKKEELLVLLKSNLDVFTWSAYGAPGVDPEFICHHLNVNPAIMPKR